MCKKKKTKILHLLHYFSIGKHNIYAIILGISCNSLLIKILYNSLTTILACVFWFFKNLTQSFHTLVRNHWLTNITKFLNTNIKKLLLFTIHFNHLRVQYILNSIIITYWLFFIFTRNGNLLFFTLKKQNVIKIVICCFKI